VQLTCDAAIIDARANQMLSVASPAHVTVIRSVVWTTRVRLAKTQEEFAKHDRREYRDESQR
jgi:hypothetical protein